MSDNFYNKLFGPDGEKIFSVRRGKNTRGKETLILLDAGGQKLGRPILENGKGHRNLMARFPNHEQLLAPTTKSTRLKWGVLKKLRKNVTSRKALGFKSLKQLEQYVKDGQKRGVNLTSTIPLEDIRTWLGVETGDGLPIVFRHDELHRVHSSLAYDITHEGMVTDEVTYLNQLMPYVKDLILTFRGDGNRAIQFSICSEMLFVKFDANGDRLPASSHFHSANRLLVGIEDLDDLLRKAQDKIHQSFVEFLQKGSGWSLMEIKGSKLDLLKKSLERGSSYLPLPNFLRNKHIVRNVVNTKDHYCFWYCLVLSRYSDRIGKHYERTSVYNNNDIFKRSFPIVDEKYPVKLHKKPLEEMEDLFKVNLVIFKTKVNPANLEEKFEIDPAWASTREQYEKTVFLLLLESVKDGTGHYCLVHGNWHCLFTCPEDSRNNFHMCYRCFFRTTSKRAYDFHLADCKRHSDVCRIILPPKGRHEFKFTAFSKEIGPPVFMVWDSEASNKYLNVHKTDSLELVAKQEINSIRVLLVDTIEGTVKEGTFYGEDVPVQFLQWALQEGAGVYNKYFRDQANKPMVITASQEMEFEQASECCFCQRHLHVYLNGVCTICGTDAQDDRVRHHNHFTGNYEGAAHSSCNLLRRVKAMIPILAHNMTSYDSHFIIQGLEKMNYQDIQVTGENAEKLKCISLRVKLGCDEKTKKLLSYTIRFVDSMAFLSSSLEKVVARLRPDQMQLTRRFAQELGTEKGLDEELVFQELREKGYYPYDAVTGPAAFEWTEPPPVEAFKSRLSQLTETMDPLSQEEYHVKVEKMQQAFAKQWRFFGFQDFRQAHDLYLRKDVYLLADALLNFIDVMHTKLGVHPLWYMGIPGLGLDGMLRKLWLDQPETRIELLHEGQEDMYLMCESARVGGICTVGGLRYAKANNQEVKDFDPSQPTSWITYVDATSLYPTSMCRPHAMGGYRLESDGDLEADPYGPTGSIWDVDVDPPVEPALQDLQADLPCFPERMPITYDMLGKRQHQDLGLINIVGPDEHREGGKTMVYHPQEKIVANLLPKKRYVLHLALLKVFLKQGWTVTKVNRVLHFQQARWLEPFIDMCIRMRREFKEAGDDFGAEMMKLIMNSLYGKLLEDQRKHHTMHIINPVEEERKFKKLCNSPDIMHGRLPRKLTSVDVDDADVRNRLFLIQTKKRHCTMTRPLVVGVSVLGISKALMYDLMYTHLKPLYGERLRLLYMDTDSFIMRVQTENVYQDFKTHLSAKFDFSNFPKDHPLFDASSRMQLGKFKIEEMGGGKAIQEVAAIRPKMYSILYGDGSEDKKAKGVARGVVQQLRHELFVKSILHEGLRQNITRRDVIYALRSIQHVPYIQRLIKTSLSGIYDKGYMLEDGVSMLPFGHHKINK